eukprot:UC1_evm1s2091
MARAWRDLAGSVGVLSSEDPGLRVAEVDCTEHPGLCKSAGVTAYPVLMLYTGTDTAEEYNGGRSREALHHFAGLVARRLRDAGITGKSSAPASPVDGLIKATSSNFLATFETAELAFIKFMTPFCPYSLELKPAWRRMARAFESEASVLVGEVDCSLDRDLCAE